jgi:hypothetical protein
MGNMGPYGPRRVAFLCLPFLLVAIPAYPQSPGEVVPLDRGRAWTYAGTVRWTDPATGEVLEQDVRRRMEVVDLIHRPPVTAAVLVGHPRDLVWFQEGRASGRYLLVRIGEGPYYLLGAEDAARAEIRLRDPADPLIGLVHGDQLYLDPPLWPGKRFCDPEAVAREDGFYCWVVEASDPVELDGVEGAPPGLYVRHRVALRTIGEHNLLDFVPGIGLTAFIFGHHGTTSDVDVRLVAVEPAIEEPSVPYRFRLSSGLFSLPDGAASVDWVVVNEADGPRRFRVTVHRVGIGLREVLAPGAVGGRLGPGEAFHNANSVEPEGLFRRGFYYEVIVEVDDRSVLPSITVWSDHRNTALPGTLIPAGAFVEIGSPRP